MLGLAFRVGGREQGRGLGDGTVELGIGPGRLADDGGLALGHGLGHGTPTLGCAKKVRAGQASDPQCV